jgi:hypothetical protein
MKPGKRMLSIRSSLRNVNQTQMIIPNASDAGKVLYKRMADNANITKRHKCKTRK